MLADSSILRPCADPGGEFGVGNAGGRIQRIDANDEVVWDFFFSNADHQQHHDIEPMPGGTVLIIAWELRSRAEAEAMGRQDICRDMWPTLIVEVEPAGPTGGTIVWEWHLWDHLIQDADPGLLNYSVVAEHPELIDINHGSVGPARGDWIHANAIDYNPELDQILFSSRSMNEFYVIDHSTTTEEAAGLLSSVSGQPNPSTGSTRICFELAEAAPVEVQIFDIAGRCVTKLACGDFAAGEHRLNWDGRDSEGRELSAGIYFARVRAAHETEVRKLILAR
jgi:hypothetical protein